MNKLLLFLFLAVSFTFSQSTMRIKNKDGLVQVISIDMIAKITFDVPRSVDPKTEQQMSAVLKTFTLMQNYPNPFNPTTNIIFAIPRPNVVSVRIYDVTGRLVKTLVNEFRSAGEHVVMWDGRNDEGQKASSGMYINEIRYDGSVMTRKMLMLK